MADYIKYMRKMIGNKPMFMVGSCAIISDSDGRILLIKRADNNRWGIPGGSLELGETFEEAAAREVLEETGITVNSLDLFNVYSGNRMHYVYPNGDEVYNTVCIFRTSDFSGTPVSDGMETSNIGFFNTYSLPDELHPPDIVILSDYTGLDL